MALKKNFKQDSNKKYKENFATFEDDKELIDWE
jgi:hypothetical protein